MLYKFSMRLRVDPSDLVACGCLAFTTTGMFTQQKPFGRREPRLGMFTRHPRPPPHRFAPSPLRSGTPSRDPMVTGRGTFCGHLGELWLEGLKLGSDGWRGRWSTVKGCLFQAFYMRICMRMRWFMLLLLLLPCLPKLLILLNGL